VCSSDLIESVPSANAHAKVIASSITGNDLVNRELPWFWSDQYEVKLQIAGLNAGYTNVVVRDGSSTRSHWYYKSDKLLAVDAMNDPRAYMVAKRLIEAGETADPKTIADPQSVLKELLRK
jgi:3-phenylpropionate/trans-cinnamate dioxygenase ferredoxin reductase subunit